MKISRHRLILGLMIATTIASALVIFWVVREHREKKKAILTVKESVLYRSRQPDPLKAGELSQRGITQVINFRERYEDENTFDVEAAACRQAGVKYVNIGIGTLLPSDRQVETFLRLVIANPGATLVHCCMGKSRTGMMVTCYLIVVEGWTFDRAMDDFLQNYYKEPPERHRDGDHAKIVTPLFQRLFNDRKAWLDKIHNPSTQP